MDQIKLLDPYRPLFQKPKHRYYILTGGRGSAKSYHVAYFLTWLMHEPDHVILYSRYTLVSAHLSIIPEFIEKIELLGKEDEFHVTKTEIIYKPTNSRIVFRGIKTSQGIQTARLKSIQGLTTWVLDEAEELIDPEIFEAIDLSIRQKGMDNRVIIIMNPSYKDHFIYQDYILPERDDTVHIHTTYKDNEVNLSKSFIDQAERLQKVNPHRYEHLYMGSWLEDQEGLLWSRAIINRTRIHKHPELTRIIVSIDPAITAKADSDETGIVVLGKDAHGNGYVLDDSSGRYTPEQWASESKRLADRWGATAYIAEKNQGGDMVQSVLRQVDKARRVKLVTATKGKYLRAEPIFSLYEQNVIFHVGEFAKLEQQMITFNPEAGGSPDRVDALVHGFTELFSRDKIITSFLA